MRPHRSDCCRNTRYFKKALCPKDVLRQSPFHSAGATLLRDAEAFMYLQHKCPYGGKHLSLKNPARTANKPGPHCEQNRPALRTSPARTANKPGPHCEQARHTPQASPMCIGAGPREQQRHCTPNIRAIRMRKDRREQSRPVSTCLRRKKAAWVQPPQAQRA